MCDTMCHTVKACKAKAFISNYVESNAKTPQGLNVKHCISASLKEMAVSAQEHNAECMAMCSIQAVRAVLGQLAGWNPMARCKADCESALSLQVLAAYLPNLRLRSQIHLQLQVLTAVVQLSGKQTCCELHDKTCMTCCPLFANWYALLPKHCTFQLWFVAVLHLAVSSLARPLAGYFLHHLLLHFLYMSFLAVKHGRAPSQTDTACHVACYCRSHFIYHINVASGRRTRQ